MVETGHRFAGLILAGTFVFTSCYMSYKTLQFIQTIPVRYYQQLPVSHSTDLDSDGIPDYIDDSDGDGVADEDDPTPYKDAKSGSLEYRLLQRSHLAK